MENTPTNDKHISDDYIVQTELYQSLWTDYIFLEQEKNILEQEKDLLEQELGQLTYRFNGIVNILDFKYHLQQDNLLTPELENFINEYMKYYNKDFLPIRTEDLYVDDT